MIVVRKRLNELGTVDRGRSRHRPRNEPALYGGPYPFVQTGDIKASPFYITTHDQTYSELGLSQSKLWPEGTLCLTIAANIGDSAILTYPACFPDSVIGFVSNPEVSDTRFVKYLLDSFQNHFKAISRGTTQDNLSIEKLCSVELPVPPLEIQRKIAGVLSAYDDLIENNRRRIAILENMAEEIYREWFVRMRFPGHQDAKFEKGVPVGWEVKRFGDFCTLKRGYDLPEASIVDGQFPVIASTSIKAWHHASKVEPPVITTGRSGSLGQVLFTEQSGWPLNTTLYVKNFHGNSPYLIFFTLKGLKLENFNAGAGVPTLNRNHLNGLKMSVPSLDIQAAFDAKIAPIWNLRRLLETGANVMASTRDSLLSRLISGKLPIDELEIRLPPSMTDDAAEEAGEEVAHA